MLYTTIENDYSSFVENKETDNNKLTEALKVLYTILISGRGQISCPANCFSYKSAKIPFLSSNS